MQKDTEQQAGLVSVRTMEIVVALVIMAFAATVIVSNYRLGAAWGSDGPQPGYFPFYVGIITFLAAGGTLAQQFLAHSRDAARESFVEGDALRRVFQMLVPTIIYVILIAYIGIYVSTAIFVGFFMIWLGRYPLHIAIPIAIGVAVALFVTFEVWFLVPLPKGPLEAWFGY